MDLEELETNAKGTSSGEALDTGNTPVLQGSRVGAEDEVLSAGNEAGETLDREVFLRHYA